MAMTVDDNGNWYDDGTTDDYSSFYGSSGSAINIGGDNYTPNSDGTWTLEDPNGKQSTVTAAQMVSIFNPSSQPGGNAAMDSLREAAYKEKLQEPSFVDQINKALGTKFSPAELLKIGVAGLGGIAGAMGAGTPTVKPTGYQGGIPQLTASQPMLTEPPPGRRPGSGGINYGTGVQYKDAKGNIVSDTSTPVADLYNKATQQGTYNDWGHQYGNTPTPITPAPFTFTPAAPHTSVAPPPPPPPPPPPAGGNAGGNNTVVNNGIATGIDPNHPWLKASSDPAIKAIQNELEQLSHTSGTPEQRQAALVNFLHTTKDTPAQLAAASNGQWGVQDLIDQMQGNTNVFNAQTPWSVYSTKADVKGVQDALQQLSQTPGTAAEKQAALTNFLKTTNYTPAQLAAASNGMWSVADLSSQMAGNPNLTAANTVDPSHPWTTASSDQTIQGAQAALAKLNATTGTPAERQAVLANFLKTTTYTPAQLAAASNGQWGVADLTTQMAGNPNLPEQGGPKGVDQTSAGNGNAASTPTGGGFVAGGGSPPSAAEYAKMVAVKKAQDAADQAKLDAYHISPDSPLYKYIQDPKSIPHLYGETDAQAVARVKSQDMERTNTAAYRSTLSNVSPGGGFVVSNGYIGRDPTANETNTVVQDANGQSRYMTKPEAAAQEKATQDYLKAHGNILDTEHPWNVASTDTGTQSAQAALAQLNATTGTPAERQAALVNFLKTTTYTPEQLSAASNGQWAVSDLSSQMAGNPNLPEQGGPKGQDKTSAGNAPTGGLAALATQAAEQPQFNGGYPMEGGIETPQFNGGYPMQIDPNSIWQNPGSPVAPTDPFQSIYGRAATPEEAAWAASQSPEAVQSTLTSSLASWNADHPKAMAQGGLTNLNHGGFVIPADVVSHFGNGSSEAGLKLLQHKLGATPIRGHGDGMSDSIPAAIDGREKALVANEEAYISPQMVQRLGGGSMDKGSQKLAHMMEKIRKARTGSKEQGKQVNPNNFMPGGTVGYAQGGGIKSYAGTTDPTSSLVQSGVTGTEQNLSNWVGPYATQMLGQTQALANTPYQAYTGPLTAGASGLQNLSFQNAANLSVPSGVDYAGQQMAQIGDQAQKSSYDPATFGNQFQAPTPYQNTNFTSGTFDSGAAQQYMNPYLQQSLDPQLAEARRQSDITNQTNNAAMTKAGAFGGGRQAIMSSENQRNLGTNLANITGQGYNTAYTNAMSQYNQDQARNMQAQQASEQSKQFGAGQGMTAAQMAAQYGLAGQQAGEASRQFGANYGIQGLNTALQSAQGLGNLGIASGGLSLQNLNTQAGLGATQRGIESEGIAADKAQFEAARQDPYTKLQFQQSMLNGLPISAQNYTMSTPSTFTSAAGGATTLAQLLKNLGYTTTP